MNKRVPSLTNDPIALLGPLVSQRAIELARLRIATPRHRLVDNKGRTNSEGADVVKVALMLLRAMNPVEELTNSEEGHLRGNNADTVGKRKAAGDLHP